jgi:ankyrin repeat protein
VVTLLLAAYADVHVVDEGSGKTALTAAAEAQPPATANMRLLLNAQADVNAVDYGGATALHYACSSGDIDSVRLLLDAGADPTLRKLDDTTTLMSASVGVSQHYKENPDILIVLVDALLTTLYPSIC